MLSVDNFCKQFGPRVRLTNCLQRLSADKKVTTIGGTNYIWLSPHSYWIRSVNSLFPIAPWVIFHAFRSSADFFQNQFFWKILSGMPLECQTVWIQMRPDILSGLIRAQTFCKQTTLGGKDIYPTRIQLDSNLLRTFCLSSPNLIQTACIELRSQRFSFSWFYQGWSESLLGARQVISLIYLWNGSYIYFRIKISSFPFSWISSICLQWKRKGFDVYFHY